MSGLSLRIIIGNTEHAQKCICKNVWLRAWFEVTGNGVCEQPRTHVNKNTEKGGRQATTAHS